MISVFTPCHNTQYLEYAKNSLLAQTYETWEWVVLLNGPAKDSGWTCDDPRVKVHTTDTTNVIGRLKREAVALCTGDILVELDHDDELLPEALEAIYFSFKVMPNVVFVYSDTAQIDEFNHPEMSEFSADHGWTYYEEDGYKVARSFKPTPHNVSYIWYAPNHVRAFRRDAYEAVGGYDPDLSVMDDQDLMNKLYQHGSFHHIAELLYLQRVHAGNTQRDPDTNAAIQRETHYMYKTNIEPNALAWAKRQGLLALDLGGYHNKRAGYLGVDMRPAAHVDIVEDFMNLDLPDNSVGVIRAVDFLEHIPNRIGVMEKIWRLLAHGGMLLSETPSTDGRGAWQDPTHVSYWNENSFWYFTDDNYRKYIESDAKFHISSLSTYTPSQWHNAQKITYVRANLVAVKEPGIWFGGPNHI